MKTIEGIRVWDRACDLAIQICETLNSSHNSNLRDDTTRASLAVAANIAEGYEHHSRQHFCEYLTTARGSCAKLRTHLYIASELDIIDKEESIALITETLELSSQLDNLIEQHQLKYCAWN